MALFLLIISVFMYFIPAIVGRNKRNLAAIFWLNFLLGWTVAGWIVSLIWALTKDATPAQVIVNQPTQPSVLCSDCGKYSPPSAKFCAICGATITT